MTHVRFQNESEYLAPRSPKFNKARRENQQMLQELATYRREVEANTNSNSVKRLTRKRNMTWSPATAKERANELALDLGYGPSIPHTKKAKRGKKRTAKRKTHAHKHLH